MVMESGPILGRPKSHAERRRTKTAQYALTTTSGTGGSHFHTRQSDGGRKPDVSSEFLVIAPSNSKQFLKI